MRWHGTCGGRGGPSVLGLAAGTRREVRPLWPVSGTAALLGTAARGCGDGSIVCAIVCVRAWLFRG